MTKIKRNLVGPTVRKLRYKQKYSQAQLAARCQLLGWNASRDMIAAIEGQVRCVIDGELMILGKVLDVELTELFPSKSDLKDLEAFVGSQSH